MVKLEYKVSNRSYQTEIEDDDENDYIGNDANICKTCGCTILYNYKNSNVVEYCSPCLTLFKKKVTLNCEFTDTDKETWIIKEKDETVVKTANTHHDDLSCDLEYCECCNGLGVECDCTFCEACDGCLEDNGCDCDYCEYCDGNENLDNCSCCICEYCEYKENDCECTLCENCEGKEDEYGECREGCIFCHVCDEYKENGCKCVECPYCECNIEEHEDECECCPEVTVP